MKLDDTLSEFNIICRIRVNHSYLGELFIVWIQRPAAIENISG